ncbi:MAG: redoxin family protein [Bryobacteraceae bacterium]
MRVAILLAALCALAAQDPFSTPARVRVLVFVRTDCPITNRYAPELQRLAAEFKDRGVDFWLVYPDHTETTQAIEAHIAQYHFPGIPLRDPDHQLVKRAHATVAPEAAVFDRDSTLVYHGRIDDRWVDLGKSRPYAQTHDLENAISAVLAGKPVSPPETRAVGCSLADVE